jgi:hypothetical protein
MDTQHPRARLEVTVMFEPTRLAPATLHLAYTLLLPGPGRAAGSWPLARLSPEPFLLSAAEPSGGTDEDAPSGALRPRIV